MEKILLLIVLGVAQGHVITVWRIYEHRELDSRDVDTSTQPDVYACIRFCLAEKSVNFYYNTGQCNCNSKSRMDVERYFLMPDSSAQFSQRELVMEGTLFVMAKQTEHSGLISGPSARREGDADVAAVRGVRQVSVDSRPIACNAKCQRVAGCNAVVLTPSGRCQLLLNLVIL